VKFIYLSTVLCAACSCSVLAAENSLSASSETKAAVTIQSKAGTPEEVSVSVQFWALSNQQRTVPLRGFYLARVVSGVVSATIDGRTVQHIPGDYWSVNPGATMEVNTLGQGAVLETTVLSKP
jgi:hypothetical protein